MIESYLRDVERRLVGSPDQKRETLAELESHLRDAEASGDLEDALDRLGSPREAAAAFSSAVHRSPALRRARALAALVDYSPLLAATVVVAALDVSDGGSLMITFPAGLRLDGGWGLWNLATPLALAWSVLGVALLEVGNGRTPGKALAGIQTVSDDGTAVGMRQAIVRRIPLTFGPFLWLDVIATAFTRGRRRLFDLAAHTMVVTAPSANRAPAGPVPRQAHTSPG